MSLFRKINFSLIALAILIFVMAFIQYRGFSIVQSQTNDFLDNDIPAATQSVKMLNELSDMHVNLLRYLEGEDTQSTNFETNVLQYNHFRSLLPKEVESQSLVEVDSLFRKMAEDSRRFILFGFKPRELVRSRALAEELINNVGKPLDELVSILVNEEMADAGVSGDLEEIMTDDIPGVKEYTSLQKSVRIMIASLDRYILGDANAKKNFFEESLNIQEHLIALRKLESRPIEVVRIDELQRLTNFLKARGTDVFAAYSNTSKATATQVMDSISRDMLEPINTRIEATSDQSQKNMADKITLIGALSSKTILIINISSLIAILSVLILTLFIRKSVINPLSDIMVMVRKIRNREKNWTPEHIERNDEIGEIINSLVDLQVDLSTLEKMQADHMKEFEAEHMSKLQLAYNELKANESDRKKQSEYINTMNKELEQFVHIASHDLREPVKILLGYCEMLKVKAAGALDDGSKMLLEKIESSGVRMAQLIDDLRMLTKLNQENIPKETRDIKKIVESIVSDYSEKLKARNTTVSIGSLPTMSCYPTFIWQLFDNLVRNSLVHGPEKLVISVYTEERDDEKVIIYSNNADSDLEMSDELFLPFKRGRGTKKEGSGIGLSICKKIVELHGGKIWFDNSKPKSFTVCIILKDK